jgi:cyclophilin family peptidyl-prolyl cis-trans isomerase
MAQLLQKYPQDVRFIYRHFPLDSIHDKAKLGVQAAEAAGLQSKFWEMHDAIFAGQSEWSEMTVDQFQQWVIDKATALGLDKEKFTQDLNSEAMKKLAQDAWDAGQASGLPGTPFLLFNNRPYQGANDLGTLSAIVDSILLEKRQFKECPPMTIDPNKKYQATLKTEKGDIVLELYADKAPLAVNSFIYLANQNWFDGVTFHRVIPDFVAQAGDPSGTGFGGPGYLFDNEISADLKFDQPGIVGMANAGPGTNGSQFFITFAPAPDLDGNYTVFGKVISGLDIAKSLTPRDPSQQGVELPPGDKILNVVIEEK